MSSSLQCVIRPAVFNVTYHIDTALVAGDWAMWLCACHPFHRQTELTWLSTSALPEPKAVGNRLDRLGLGNTLTSQKTNRKCTRTVWWGQVVVVYIEKLRFCCARKLFNPYRRGFSIILDSVHMWKRCITQACRCLQGNFSLCWVEGSPCGWGGGGW